jgi:isocitrate dehydrogenase
MTKDNMVKHTDGLFHEVYEDVAADDPDVESEHRIIDTGAGELAARPEEFDVVVAANLYGHILSDITAEVAGSVGLAGSANIGPEVSLFEAVHGTAPDIAGEGIANPSGLLNAATKLLVHEGAPDVAQRIRNAWLETLEDGIHTPDVYREETSTHQVGTEGFADAVIDRLGDEPSLLEPERYDAFDVNVRPEPKPGRPSSFAGSTSSSTGTRPTANPT